jgi:hypothetical protein
MRGKNLEKGKIRRGNCSSIGDMVAQAAMAGQIHLANNTKPISPRLLLPMNSPGSVTPMDLDGGESQGYMAARGIKHEEMVAAMVRMEEERDREREMNKDS